MDKEVLIIDAANDFAPGLKKLLSEKFPDLKVLIKQKLSSGLDALSGGTQIVVLSDNLPDSSGLDALRSIKSYYPETVVIMVVFEGKQDEITSYMQEGAFCALQRPLGAELAEIAVGKALIYVAMREELNILKAIKPPKIIGKSQEMLRALRQIEKAASSDEPIFIAGEAGTGKRLAAETIHLKSRRKNRPFIEAKAKDLTDASKEIHSSPGTIYITGAHELSVQRHELLTALGQRANGARLIIGITDESVYGPADVKLPPLRRRRQDILPLAEHFMELACRFFGKKKLSKEAEQALLEHHWPGNVSELKDVIQRACAISSDGTIGRYEILSGGIGTLKDFLERKLLRYLGQEKNHSRLNLWDIVLDEAGKALIELVLKETGGNKLRAASMLGISRNTLMTKIKQYKIKC